MTRFDGMAFDAPEIKETQHGAMPRTDRATPETTSNAMVNDPVGTVELENLPTLNCPEDTSVGMFFFNMAGGAE